MVNILQWDEFQKAAEELYLLSPNTTRYVAKYRHVEGKLVLKVTDDRTCLKYKTDQMQDLNKFERLNRSLMAKMHNRIPAPVTENSAPAATAAPSSSSTVSAPGPAQAAVSATISSPSIQQGGGGKAKKNKRR
ncbi:signal recognition particle, SRP9/SRP14 subunit [Gamsiella multidivaricata]|uniref:signal recognition particle, SRP9/SRP14 subunit n=1 Tax=Gamsiella multidivaricata TaxID=101098 RepID=UPI00221F007F|nr:signal recognition particle, SRP9/SRP14 subunit [Gamsiella multidivaricata]KAG0365215.1 Signal recognition particle protein [Gamsiella multidivaricata]KAI7829871.1 signal recognition particle, SRP9/SRP14 subunit [Gamsiella multidivaricata]